MSTTPKLVAEVPIPLLDVLNLIEQCALALGCTMATLLELYVVASVRDGSLERFARGKVNGKG